MRLQIKKTYLLAASALFLWGWNLLLPAMLFIDMFLLALVSALADLLLKQREETWIPLLAYPLSPRPLILRTCLRHCGMVAAVQSSFLPVSICRCDHSAAVRIAGRLQRFIAAHLSGPGWVSQRWDAAGQRRTGRHAPAAVSAALSAE